MVCRDDQLGQERRQYIRLDSVFPVEFRLESLDGKSFFSGWVQGFTNNVGKGGICLSVNNLDPQLLKLLKEKKAKLSLSIEMPLSKKPITAQAEAAWVRDVPGQPKKRIIGLSYGEIKPLDNQRIMRYARAKKAFVPLVLTTIVILGLGLAVNSYINVKLTQGNKALIKQLVAIIQESSLAKQKIKEIYKEKEDLQVRIEALKLRIQAVEEAREMLGKDALIKRLAEEKSSLQEELIGIQGKESSITEELLRLDKRKASLERANFEKMYQWLKVHQNPRTGLVTSFIGEGIVDKGFLYDQALAVQAYTNFSEFRRARKILTFFETKAQGVKNLFFNANYTEDGRPVKYEVLSGPNIWLGIAIAHYSKKSGDLSFMQLAEEIAGALIDLQEQDEVGGIRAEADTKRYSVEHNLSAYAFFNMLYKLTGKPEYQQAADKVLVWLQQTYKQADFLNSNIGGNLNIVADACLWSIAAIGPERLEELGIVPDRFVELSEQYSLVTVPYPRPEGQIIRIKGFDFSPASFVEKAKFVSSEWTAQMVMAFKILSDFYYKKGMVAKARTYGLKADEYLSGLSNMIIANPSPSGRGEGCLPFATEGSVDTGHGWMTPENAFAGSVSGTAFALFAYYNYNPLELKD